MRLDLEPLRIKIQNFTHEGPDSLLDPTSETFNLQDYCEDLAFQTTGEVSDSLKQMAFLIRKWPFDDVKFRTICRDVFQQEVAEKSYSGVEEWKDIRNYIVTNLYQNRILPRSIIKLVYNNFNVKLPYFSGSIKRGDIVENLMKFIETSNKMEIRHLHFNYLKNHQQYVARLSSNMVMAKYFHECLGLNYWKYEFDGQTHNFYFMGSEVFGELYSYCSTPMGAMAIPQALVEGEIEIDDLSLFSVDNQKGTIPPQVCNFNGRLIEIAYRDVDFWNYPNLLIINNGHRSIAISQKASPYVAFGIASNGYVKSPLRGDVYRVAEVIL